MRAVVSRSAGAPQTLVVETLPDPVPGPHDVLLEVWACAVNYPDVLIIEDRYQFKPPRPFSPGGEVAGVVRQVGAEVTRFAPGDRVICAPGWGGMAELLVCPQARCVRMPDAMRFEEGAALFTCYGTAYYALQYRGRAAAGERMLVLGAAGGIGLATVELGKALGLTVVAAASSADKVALARELGADAGTVYPASITTEAERRQLAAQFKDAAPGGFDIVVDAVGGPYTEAAMRALAWSGRLLIIGFPAGIAHLPLNLPLLKGADVVGVFLGAFLERQPEENERILQALFALHAQQRIRPHVSRTFPLQDAASAIALVASREARGKVVVTVTEGATGVA